MFLDTKRVIEGDYLSTRPDRLIASYITYGAFFITWGLLWGL